MQGAGLFWRTCSVKLQNRVMKSYHTNQYLQNMVAGNKTPNNTSKLWHTITTIKQHRDSEIIQYHWGTIQKVYSTRLDETSMFAITKRKKIPHGMK